MKTGKFLLIIVMMVSFSLSGCSQAQVEPPKDMPQDVHTELTVESEPAAEPVSNPEPVSEPSEPVILPQPQADGTGISFALPDDWNKYPADALQDLQTMIDESGNRVLYGVLHGFMEAQEISDVSLADSSVDDYGDMVHYYPAYDVSLDDGTILRLKFAATGWNSGEDSDGGMYFDGLYFVEAYPAFENCYWSLELEYDENMEGRYDWVYQIMNGDVTRYYSISEDSLQEYTILDDYDDYYDDYYENPGATYMPEEPTRLTQYEWPDYCDEIDCLMMESVGLQYNKSFGTATKLLTSGSLITISIIPKIGGGAEYGANVRVDNSTTIPVKSSDGINYQCKSTGGKGGNMGGYSGLWITLTKDGWSNWY